MHTERTRLIQEMAAELQPIRRPGRTAARALLWLAISMMVSVLVIVALGPMRPGFAAQLQQSGQLLVETLLGVAAFIFAGLAALRLGVPAPAGLLRRVGLPLLLLLLWLAFNTYGLVHPALPWSAAGERAHCYIEVLMAGIPGMLLGLWLARRWYHLYPATSGLLIGLAAGVASALVMQFACMYVPLHNIAFHLLPGLMVGVLGAVIGRRYLRPD